MPSTDRDRLRRLEHLEDHPLLGRHAQVGLLRDVLQDYQPVHEAALVQMGGEAQGLGGKDEVDVHLPEAQPEASVAASASRTTPTSWSFSKGLARNRCSLRSVGHQETSLR